MNEKGEKKKTHTNSLLYNQIKKIHITKYINVVEQAQGQLVPVFSFNQNPKRDNYY